MSALPPPPAGLRGALRRLLHALGWLAPSVLTTVMSAVLWWLIDEPRPSWLGLVLGFNLAAILALNLYQLLRWNQVLRDLTVRCATSRKAGSKRD